MSKVFTADVIIETRDLLQAGQQQIVKIQFPNHLSETKCSNATRDASTEQLILDTPIIQHAHFAYANFIAVRFVRGDSDAKFVYSTDHRGPVSYYSVQFVMSATDILG